MLKLVIFDYDGLLVNTEEIVFLAEKKLLKDYGIKLTLKIFFNLLGRSVKETMIYYKRKYSLKESVEKLLYKRHQIYHHLLKKNIKLRKGALELLEFLEKNKIRKVIASSGTKEHVMHGLKALKIETLFEEITTVDEVKEGKPAPDLFLKALEKANARDHVKRSEALVLEDSLTGVRAAKAARIKVIAVPFFKQTFPSYSSSPLIASSLKEVKKLFDYLI